MVIDDSKQSTLRAKYKTTKNEAKEVEALAQDVVTLTYAEITVRHADVSGILQRLGVASKACESIASEANAIKDYETYEQCRSELALYQRAMVAVVQKNYEG